MLRVLDAVGKELFKRKLVAEEKVTVKDVVEALALKGFVGSLKYEESDCLPSDIIGSGNYDFIARVASSDHISTLALHRYHQRDWQSAFIGPTKYWFCEATLTSLDKISVQIELTVDTGCSADIILPAKLLERLGSSPLSSAPVKATTGNGDVILKRYPPLMVSIPLYEPPASQTLESYQTTRDHQAKVMYLDAFAPELQEEPFEDMFSDVGDQEIKSPPTKKPSLEGASVPLQPLTRHVLDAKNG